MVGFDTIGPGNKERKKEYKKAVRRGKKSLRKEPKAFKKDQKKWDKAFKEGQKKWKKEEKAFAKELGKAGYNYEELEKQHEERRRKLMEHKDKGFPI